MNPPLPHRWMCRLLAGVAVCALAPGLRASIAYDFSFTTGFANGGAVPDGDLNGWQDARSLGSLPAGLHIDSVTIALSLSGGYNGDLYCYVLHDGALAVLLNRPGRTAIDPFGYGDPGMNVTFSEVAPADIHLYGGNNGAPLTGLWKPDGRSVNPVAVIDTDPSTATLSQFNGVNPQGDWSLFVADVSSGEQTTVASWSLHLETSPEGAPDAGSTAGLLALGAAALYFQARSGRAGEKMSENKNRLLT